MGFSLSPDTLGSEAGLNSCTSDHKGKQLESETLSMWQAQGCLGTAETHTHPSPTLRQENVPGQAPSNNGTSHTFLKGWAIYQALSKFMYYLLFIIL